MKILSGSTLSKQYLWIAFAALAIRITYIYVNQRGLFSDELDYHTLAANLSTTFHYAAHGLPTAYRPIGYPAIIALVYWIAGIHPIVVKVFQAIVDSSIVLVVPRLMSHSTDNAKLYAAGAWASFPSAILYPNLLMTECIYTALVVAAALLYVKESDRSIQRCILLGVVCGTLTLIKPATILFFAALGALALKKRESRQNIAAVCIAFVLVVTPWVVRNWVVIGEPTIATNSGVNLLIGNNPHANGSYNASVDVLALDSVANEADRDKLAFSTGVRYIVSRPFRFVVNAGKKYAHLFSSESFLAVTQFHPNPNNVEQSLSEKYASISSVVRLIINVPYAAALLVGFLGFISAKRTRLWYFFAALLTSLLCIHLTTFGGNRFHFPLMPFFVIFAINFLTDDALSFSAMSRARKLVFGVAAASVCSVWIVEMFIVLRA